MWYGSGLKEQGDPKSVDELISGTWVERDIKYIYLALSVIETCRHLPRGNLLAHKKSPAISCGQRLVKTCRIDHQACWTRLEPSLPSFNKLLSAATWL